MWFPLSLAAKTFDKVVRLLVSNIYDEYVKMSNTDEEWENDLRGFIENFETPYTGVWDGFHVYVSSKLKPFYNFKKCYTMSSLGLVSYSKRFLWTVVGAPYHEILNGKIISDCKLHLEGGSKVPLVSVGDSAFPRHPWLLKGYNEETQDSQ